MRKKLVKRMCFNAIFAALSIILYVVGPKFPLPFIFPGFLDIQFSMLPILIVTFMLGPIDGMIVALTRFGIKLAFGSTTSGVGEISDLILTLVTILLVSVVMKKVVKEDGKYKFSTMLITIIVSWVIGSLLSNSFCIPMYCLIFSKETVIGMISIFPFVNESNWLAYYFFLAVIPFNLLLSSIVGVTTLIVDKHLKPIYNRLGTKKIK